MQNDRAIGQRVSFSEDRRYPTLRMSFRAISDIVRTLSVSWNPVGFIPGSLD
jgi:hypothetical protein